MRYRILFLLGIFPLLAIGQNPLKKELKGNSTSMYYSPSQFNFTNQNGATVFIDELKDRRSLNWNKQINDSVKIEAIGDFWNFPMNILFKNKISQDLTKANVTLEYSVLNEGMYKIEPTLEVLYPNFVSFPEKGYWILARMNMQVSKGSQKLFTKSYQEYTLFNKNINGYAENFNTDLKEGANVAMWSSIKRLLDQFYSDLNDAFGGKTVQSSDANLSSIGASNITGDANLNNQVANYSSNKNQKDINTNNYKLDGDVPPPPPPVDNKLDNAVNVLGKEPKIPTISTKSTTMPLVDSAKLAERRLREELRKKAIDSAKKAKEELALQTKKMEQEEKERLQFKRDSILKVKKEAIALKVREKFVADSIKKAEINRKIDEAKEITRKKRGDLNSTNTSTENTELKTKNEKVAVERVKPQSIAKKSSRKVANETIGEAVRRIAKEVEEEETGVVRRESRITNESVEETPKANKRAEEIAKAKAEREKILVEMKAKKMAKDSLLAIEKQKKQDSLLAIRKAKAEEIEAAMARAKASRDSINQILAAKKYFEDSVNLIKDKERRREAVLAAQKAAMEAERNVLIKNPNAGEMFATVSTDPPSKLPETRTREQILADRIFTPKSETTKNLLARVKLITPEEEAKLLAQMNTEDKAIADSFFIQIQKNRPIPTYTPIDTAKPAENAPDASKKTPTKEDKKAQIIEKGLKGSKNQKMVKDKILAKKDSVETSIVAAEKAKETSTAKENMAAKTEAPALDSAQAEQKAKDLESEIEKKKKEISERLKKAKSW